VGRVRPVDGDPLAPVGVRYLTRALNAFVASPPDAADRVIEKVAVRWESARRRGQLPANHAAQQWERDLHAMLGAAWPCPHAQAFAGTWEGVLETMTSGGLSVGRRNYGDQDDADPGFARALWCIVHHLHAEAVIETGVAHGVSSRVMLEALREDSGGRLYSIDLPPMLVPQRWSEMAVAVPLELRDRWTLLKGSSRRQLPDLLRRLGRIDLFVHDSRHSTRNVHWELSAAWPLLAPGGVVVVDDADVNWGFERFLRRGDDREPLWCIADDGQRQFAIARKSSQLPPHSPVAGERSGLGRASAGRGQPVSGEHTSLPDQPDEVSR
jgi:methyltransferase family protein